MQQGGYSKNKNLDSGDVLANVEPQKIKTEPPTLSDAGLTNTAADLVLSGIDIQKNEMFCGELIGIIKANQEQGASAGLTSVVRMLTGGASIRNLSEQIPFTDENGKEMSASVDNLVTNGKFKELSHGAQANFIKAFREYPETIKSPLRKRFDKAKTTFLSIFGVVGIGAGITGFLLAINAAAPFLGAAATVLPWILTAVGVIGLGIGVAALVSKIISYRKNLKNLAINQETAQKSADLIRDVSQDKAKAKQVFAHWQSEAKNVVKNANKKGIIYNFDSALAESGAKTMTALRMHSVHKGDHREVVDQTNKPIQTSAISTQANHTEEALINKDAHRPKFTDMVGNTRQKHDSYVDMIATQSKAKSMTTGAGRES